VEYFYRVFSKKLKWISLTKGMTSTNQQTLQTENMATTFSGITNIVEYIKAKAIEEKRMWRTAFKGLLYWARWINHELPPKTTTNKNNKKQIKKR
jgi:hypothetical protein